VTRLGASHNGLCSLLSIEETQEDKNQLHALVSGSPSFLRRGQGRFVSIQSHCSFVAETIAFTFLDDQLFLQKTIQVLPYHLLFPEPEELVRDRGMVGIVEG